MSNSENISRWKKKSEIDYIPLFMSLWLSLNAWLKDRPINTKNENNDRELINSLKDGDNQLSYKFSELLYSGHDGKSITFKGYFSELYRALENANIEFHKLPVHLIDYPNKKVSFANTVLYWGSKKSSFESILKEGQQRDRLKISTNFYIDKDDARVFRAYIENLYQIRCSLFHGDLPPSKENERVIRAFYLTLSMIMERV